MSQIFARIVAFFMSILAFFGFVKKGAEPKPDAYAVEKKVVTFCFDSNPSTGYTWTVKVEGDAVALTRDDFVAKETSGHNGVVVAVAGAGGMQYYGFTAVKPGRATVTFTYARSWEQTDADRTVVAVIAVDEDLAPTVESFEE